MISRRLKGAENLTLDTVSDLVRAMGTALKIQISTYADQTAAPIKVENRFARRYGSAARFGNTLHCDALQKLTRPVRRSRR